CEKNNQYRLRLTTPGDIAHLFAPRSRNSNKGMYGHVLVVAGSIGKTGAPAMTGLAALRIGAGLVTVASAESAIPNIAGVSPELMTELLPQTKAGHIAKTAREKIGALLQNKTLLALGPGLGTDPETVELVRDLYERVEQPLVVDADGLNALAGGCLQTEKTRILTPHPGEMGRLTGKSAKEVQAARLDLAEELAQRSGATIVLKGDRTVIAFADGDTWVNPTGSPSLATGGTGDILTGMISGLVAQFPRDWKRAVAAAIWLHGRAGELAAEELGEQSAIATDLLRYLPAAIKECRAAV
ncbi:MAG TPA: NAD(P)H-hydrate dehydratase, partial [Bryobacteraceae bacterium]|nr:NAD(P)H-hydrate dehydratase [Bryobacteraceae bacterium]